MSLSLYVVILCSHVACLLVCMQPISSLLQRVQLPISFSVILCQQLISHSFFFFTSSLVFLLSHYHFSLLDFVLFLQFHIFYVTLSSCAIALFIFSTIISLQFFN